MLSEQKAVLHPAYNDSLLTAVRRAADDPTTCISVYWDGEAVFVRTSNAAPPPRSICICVAQRWDADTVQLRFAGARSEWVKI